VKAILPAAGTLPTIPRVAVSVRSGGRVVRCLRRAAVVAGLLVLVHPAQADDACAYSCTVIRWAAKNLSKDKIEQVVAKATAAQVAACRKCLRNNKP